MAEKGGVLAFTRFQIVFAVLLFFLQLEAVLAQKINDIKLTRNLRTKIDRQGNQVQLEVLKLIGEQVNKANLITNRDDQLIVEIPGKNLKIKKPQNSEKVFGSTVYREDNLPAGKRLILKPTRGSYERCLDDRFDFGLIVVCRINSQLAGAVTTQSDKPSSLAKSSNEQPQVKVQEESISPEAVSLITPVGDLLLRSILFQGEGDSSKVILNITGHVKFNMAAVSENLYRLVLHDVHLAHQGLNLPYFAPQYFKGVNFLKVTARPQGLVIDLQMDSGMIPRITQNRDQLIIAL